MATTKAYHYSAVSVGSSETLTYLDAEIIYKVSINHSAEPHRRPFLFLIQDAVLRVVVKQPIPLLGVSGSSFIEGSDSFAMFLCASADLVVLCSIGFEIGYKDCFCENTIYYRTGSSIEIWREGLCVYDGLTHLASFVKFSLVGIELNPGPCDWPHIGPNIKEDMRSVIRVGKQYYCPICGGRVNRIRPRSPFYHEDVSEELDYLNERRVSSADAKLQGNAVACAPCAKAETTLPIKEDSSGSTLTSETGFEDNLSSMTVPTVEEEVVVVKPVVAKPVVEQLDVTAGDSLVVGHLDAAQLNGLCLGVEKRNPRAGDMYEITNFRYNAGKDKRLPCHRGVNLINEDFVIQQIVVTHRVDVKYQLIGVVLIAVALILGVVSYWKYAASIVEKPKGLWSYITTLVTLVVSYCWALGCRIGVVFVSQLAAVLERYQWVPFFGPYFRYWAYLINWKLPLASVAFGTMSVTVAAVVVIGGFALWWSGQVWKWLGGERVYLHVPVITASMMLDNYGSNAEEKLLNLPTLFRRHVGMVNVPSDLVCAVQEGCVFVSGLAISGGLGFRLRASLAAQ